MRRAALMLFAAGATVVGGARGAGAQTLDQVLPPDVAGIANEPSVTVLSRARPAYDALGVRLGTVMIRPIYTQSAGYESNVLGSTVPRGGPVIATSGSVSATTDQSRGQGTASLTVDDVRYPEQPTQSRTDWSARANGSYSLGRDLVSVAFVHLNLNQTLRDLDVGRALNQALAFRVEDGRISYRAVFGRGFVVPSLEVTSYAYDNGRSGNSVYLQNYRNRVVVQPSVTLGYELAPRRSAIAVLRNSSGFYSNPLLGMPSREYNDTTALGGLDYDLNGVFRFRVLFGYQVRRFQSAQYRTIQAPVTEATVIWNPTGLTTVTLGAARRIQDSADQSSAAVTETNLRLQIDHEYRRNVLLQASAGAQLADYAGSSSQRLYRAGLNATYLVNRKVSLGASYEFSTRQSDSSGGVSIGGPGQLFGPSYSDNLVQLQLRFKL